MTQHRRIRTSKLALGLLAILATAPAMAQSTSAGVGGTVIGPGGAPVSGAEVTITHVESGTVSRATTDASGRYTARGLRVGGPYTVTITKPGEGTKTEDGVYLTLNQVNTVDASLTGDVTNLESVQAIGYAGGSDVFSATKMGSGTSVDQQKIEDLPSIGGNIQDFMRLDPRVAFVDRASGMISAGGQNPRYNSINIDGVSASDTFGLEGNNMPTRRQPVSMEAIEAIDIDLSNYDVSLTSATGATVNAVTKSGTNEFHGSIYGYMRDGSWFGDDPEGEKFNGFDSEKTYGATFGGPIVKDKLFFFANYEKFKQKAPGFDPSTTPLGDGGITMDQITRAQSIAAGYGIDAGTLDSNGDTDLEEYALKLDWNISENHRANFRYSKLDQSKLRINGISNSGISLSSYWYQQDKTVESYVGQLFSDWSDNFSTEFKVSYRDYSAVRNTPTTAPSVQIFFGGNENLTSPSGDSIYLGTEQYSQNNVLETKTWDYYGAGTLTLGDHDIKFGAQYSDNDIYNYFGQQSYGVYTFYGLDNFEAGRWSTYALHAETAPNSIAADFHDKNLGLFVQDTWYATNNLTLTFGLRADKPSTSPRPPVAPGVQETFGYDNTQVFDDAFLIQPRFGFNYNFESERPTQLRGGVGLFQGAAPSVWVGNSYANAGAANYIAYFESLSGDGPDYTTLPFSGDGLNQPRPTDPSSTVFDANFTSGKDFKLPSTWKANLAIDHETPWYGIVASAELLMTKVKNGLYYRSLNLGPGFTGPDGRTLYWNPNQAAFTSSRYDRDRDFGYVYLIDNTSKGKTNQFTVSLTKPWTANSDWSWSLGYTYTDAEEVGPLTSSTASSGYTYQYSFNSGEDVAKTSRYEIHDRFSGSLNWNHNFFGDYQTQVGLVYEGRSGRPYSYVFNGDANGDNRSNNDLFYVPSGQGDVLFGSITNGAYVADPAMEQKFYAWLEDHPDLAKYKGRYAPANGFRSSWVNTFDLRISQEIPGFMKGHKAQVWLDIQNVGNLINKDWGHVIDYGFYADARVARLVGISDGKYVYNFSSADEPTVANGDADGFDQGISQWSAQVGFRYEF
ncbi:TonB-dependent receptor [Pseudoxanthomonas sp. JBR18]|uniref:TonB-dependent receptor n=1 Tax=Pseudoxanthomonas sp. JBR18 TaxID=2969308 RepID=UPI002305D675|nr:TonB-dependent receptor [Pseudoxanthomonas sp. JBR18]WCE04620.1 TonB-dependent receptor [Pseudoxanthomonas sp. JBR18]